MFPANLPHARGDEPFPELAAIVAAVIYPTHVGMNRNLLNGYRNVLDIYPTHVGMNRRSLTHFQKNRHLPHARGDEPSGISALTLNPAIYPTHVGMNRKESGALERKRQSTPRTWG